LAFKCCAIPEGGRGGNRVCAGRDEEESADPKSWVALKHHKSCGADGGGVEETLGGQEKEGLGSKRRRRTSLCWGAVEGEREEGANAILAQNDLIMQQLIAHYRNDPTASFPSFLA